jgi:hypothetical protein
MPPQKFSEVIGSFGLATVIVLSGIGGVFGLPVYGNTTFIILYLYFIYKIAFSKLFFFIYFAKKLI